MVKPCIFKFPAKSVTQIYIMQNEIERRLRLVQYKSEVGIFFNPPDSDKV